MTHLILDLTTPVPSGVAMEALSAAILHGQFARRTASRSHAAICTSFSSRKMKHAFPTESSGEADALLHADVLEDVVAFLPQAVEVRFLHAARMRRAYPDLALLRLDGSVDLWEVKPERIGADRIARLGHLKAALNASGIQYEIRTPSWLRRYPQHHNATELHRLGDHPVPGPLQARIGQILACGGATTLGMLAAGTGAGIEILIAAAARGMFSVDVGTGVLGRSTMVRIARPGARSGAFEPSSRKTAAVDTTGVGTIGLERRIAAVSRMSARTSATRLSTPDDRKPLSEQSKTPRRSRSRMA